MTSNVPARPWGSPRINWLGCLRPRGVLSPGMKAARSEVLTRIKEYYHKLDDQQKIKNTRYPDNQPKKQSINDPTDRMLIECVVIAVIRHSTQEQTNTTRQGPHHVYVASHRTSR